MTTDKPLKTQITHGRQKYVDEPIRAMPKRGHDPIGFAVALAYGYGERYMAAQPQPLIIGYERVLLRWKKPEDFQ